RAGSAGAWIAPGGASNRADADRIAHLAGVENVRGTSGDDTIIGDSKANVIHGGAGRDAIEGGEGADTVSYAGAVRAVAVHLGKIDQSGADGDRIRSIENATGSAFDDHLVGSAGANALLGGRGDDRLTGGAGKDVLNGGVGDDWLYGGSGRDILTGGAGDDTFVFKSLNDSRGSGMDLISDFRRGQDHIDLSDFDAQTGRAGHQDFSFIGDTGFSQKAGQLRIEHDDYSGSKNDRTLIEGDTNGDGHADFMLAIKGLLALQASDFLF
ncbi:MAG: calcium-binding protein, partial [Hyphomicrobium sp.]